MKVYVYPADLHGCGHYRLIWVSQFLAAQGHEVVVSYPGGRRVAPNRNAKPTREAMRAALRGRTPPEALGDRSVKAELKGQLDQHGNTVGVTAPKDADVMVMQRLTHKGIVQAIPIWRANGIAVVVDVDDDLSTIHPANPAFKALHPKDGKENFGWQWCLKACELATLVTTSTPALIDRYAAHGRGVVLPNCIPEAYLRIPHADTPVIGWGGTVATHPTDLQMTGSAIGQVLDQTGTSFTVVGPPNGVEPALGLRGRNWKATGGVPLNQWPHALTQSIGIGIAPLADTLFNAAKCLDHDTRITTDRGVIPIGEITAGDRVFNNGLWKTVEAVSRELPRPGLLLTMESGKQIRLTAEHRLWRLGSGWTQAGQFNPGDRLQMTPEDTCTTQAQRAPWPSDSRMSRHGDVDRYAFQHSEDVPTVVITERWARFLGLFAGDGSASGTRVMISCDGQDQDLIDLISEDVSQMGLFPSTEKSRMWNGEVLRRRSVVASSSHLIRFLRSLGLVEVDRVKRIITIPEVIFRSPRPVMAAYLAGLFEADGGVSGTGVAFSTKHHGFAMQVQQLLGCFGIESKVTRVSNTAKSDDPKRFTSYRLMLRRAAADVFIKEVGFLSDRKRARLLEVTSKPHSNKYTPMQWVDGISSIETCFVRPVDIQVEGESFAACGFVSHNSALKPLEYAALGIPTIMSPRADYVRLNKHGIGILANKPKEWRKELLRLVNHEGARRDLSEQGRSAASDWTIEGNAWRWLHAWAHALALQRGPVRSSSARTLDISRSV